jgi:hypothetical protein
MAGKGLSIVPPGSGADEDEDRLRRLMGPHGGASQSSSAPGAPAAPAPTVPAHSAPGAQPHSMPPEPEQRVVYKAPAKETVSVRINPHLKQCLGVVGEGIGWSANRIMTVMVERAARELIDAYSSGGGGAAIEHLMRQTEDPNAGGK